MTLLVVSHCSNAGDYIVECPICGKLVPAVKINAHIDANCPAPETPAEKKESTVNKIDVSKKDSPAAPPQRMAPLFAPKVAAAPAPPPVYKPSTFNSQKRTIESTSSFNTTTAPKKKKIDAAAESMPLAAKGIYT